MFHLKKENKILLDGKMLFVREDAQIQLWLEKEEINMAYIYDTNRNKWDEFVFCPNFVNFEEMNWSQINDYTEKLLNSLVITGKFNQISSK